jgi:hypothetical protein
MFLMCVPRKASIGISPLESGEELVNISGSTREQLCSEPTFHPPLRRRFHQHLLANASERKVRVGGEPTGGLPRSSCPPRSMAPLYAQTGLPLFLGGPLETAAVSLWWRHRFHT